MVPCRRYVKPLEENALEDLGLDLNFTTFLQLTGGGSGSDGPAAAFPEDEADLPPSAPCPRRLELPQLMHPHCGRDARSNL